MSATNDGGPAFPPQVVRDGDGLLQEVSSYGMQTGMSLRDYFAAKALQGLLANPGCDYTPMTATAQAQSVADAYGLADAMLQERDK